MHLRHQFIFVSVGLAFAAPVSAQSASTYSDMFVESSVDRNIKCAATIFALGEGTDLAAVIAVFFIEDATNTLVTLGGWDNRETAALSVQSRVAFQAEDIQLSADVTIPLADLERQQFECVMNRFAG